jgi:Glycosyltransferase family 87
MLMINVMPHRMWLKTSLGLLFALGAVLYCRHYWDDAPGVALYVEAARCMLDRVPPQVCNPFYTYPPIFALVTIPLVPLPLMLQNLAWYLLTIGSLIGCFLLSAQLAQRLTPDAWSKRDLAWLYGVGVFLSLKFVFAATASQSYDALVVLLILIGLANLAEDRPGGPPVWTGVSFACAAALKATPLLFLPYLLFKRHYRTAAVMAVALVIVSLLPDLLFMVGRQSSHGSFFMAWLHQVATPALTENMAGNPNAFWVASNPNNNSLRGLVGMFVADGTPRFKTFLYPVYAAYSAVVALIILRTRNSRAALTIDGALLLVSMLMLSPMSSESHYVALVLPILAVVALWQKGDATIRRISGFFLIANFALTNAAARDLVGVTMTAWAKDHRLLIISVLLFPVFFAIQAFRPQRSIAQAGTPSAVTQQAA